MAKIQHARTSPHTLYAVTATDTILVALLDELKAIHQHFDAIEAEKEPESPPKGDERVLIGSIKGLDSQRPETKTKTSTTHTENKAHATPASPKAGSQKPADQPPGEKRAGSRS